MMSCYRQNLSDLSVSTSVYLTIDDILKIGRIIAMAINPTMLPIITIMIGSIMDVTVFDRFLELLRVERADLVEHLSRASRTPPPR